MMHVLQIVGAQLANASTLQPMLGRGIFILD